MTSKKVKAESLGCLLNNHVACYCSCVGQMQCCGCYQMKPELKMYLHCLICNTDLSDSVDKLGNFDLKKFPRGEPLAELQAASHRKIEKEEIASRGNHGGRKTDQEGSKQSFAYKGLDSSSGAAY